MITKYSDAYNTLFLEATKRLIELGVTDSNNGNKAYNLDPEQGEIYKIESLEHYFSHLRDLVYGGAAADSKDLQEAGYLFLKLPLDEPEFTINANTRKIEIPNHFLANGLSVQGDEVAEIVFFEIDRFFDATDLAAVENIVIQWENSKGDQGYTPAFIRDIESKAEEDKLIFGWPISSAITAESGKLKFLVRFYTEREIDGEPVVAYMYNTLPATITINAGLSLDPLEAEADNKLNLILGRLENSPLGGLGDATVPYFVFWDPKTNSIKLADIADIFDEIPTEGIKLAALASKNDSGTLTYGWFRENLDGTTTKLSGNDHYSWETALDIGEYVKTASFIPGVATYFEKNDEGEFQSVTVYEQDFADYAELYVRCSAYILNTDDENCVAGTYYVNAKNDFYNTRECVTGGRNGDTNVDLALLPKWTLKGPEMPVITEDFPSEILIGAEGTYQATLEIEAEHVDNKTVYVWTRNGEVIAGVESNTCSILDVANGNYEQGDYQVTLSNTKNRVTDSVSSSVVRVLNPIADVSVNVAHTGNGHIIATIGRPAEEGYETFTYKWSNGDTVYEDNSTEFVATEPGVYQLDVIVNKGSQEAVFSDAAVINNL